MPGFTVYTCCKRLTGLTEDSMLEMEIGARWEVKLRNEFR